MRQGPSVCHRSVHGPVHAAASPGRRQWRAYTASTCSPGTTWRRVDAFGFSAWRRIREW
ncbi:hypothetical protein L917_01837 [Phytophthora nicotianae]|uniref:Uncharacterized protein n=1 Tax=Phytophthora nicotianae TaxID=4792 RepID=W2LY92_PHYNI|nr:hypothetical protein L915_01924 [Phytophthora nicotianae]ETM01595.1 hypothetical protein L917_01837 [Phytophthora nicotianae]